MSNGTAGVVGSTLSARATRCEEVQEFIDVKSALAMWSRTVSRARCCAVRGGDGRIRAASEVLELRAVGGANGASKLHEVAGVEDLEEGGEVIDGVTRWRSC